MGRIKNYRFVLLCFCFLVPFLTVIPFLGEAFISFQQRQEIRNLYRAAEMDIKSQFYDGAVEKYNKLLKLGVAPRRINFRLAEVYFAARKYSLAIEKCQQCLKAKIPSSQKLKVYELLGRSYFELGKYAEAIETFREALGKFPKASRLHYRLGLVYFRSDLFNQTLKECERAIALGLSTPGLWLLAGDISSRNYRLERAIQYYGKVEDGKELKEAKYKSGRIFLQQREFEKAREMFEQAVQIASDEGWPYAGIGESYFRENRFPQAEKFFRKALQLDPHLSRPRIGLSIIWLERRDYAEAQKALEQISRGGVDFQTAYFLRGLIFYYQEEFSQAKEIFKKIRVSGPDGLISQLVRQFLAVMGE